MNEFETWGLGIISLIISTCYVLACIFVPDHVRFGKGGGGSKMPLTSRILTSISGFWFSGFILAGGFTGCVSGVWLIPPFIMWVIAFCVPEKGNK